MAHARIENIDFTLFYDYDQLRDRKLALLTNDGKIQWFMARMDMVFLEPVRRIMFLASSAFLPLHSNEWEPFPPRTAAIAAFSVLLNGVESCGSFLTPKNSKKGNNFRKFMKDYMKRWCTTVSRTTYQNPDLLEVLWKHFRNGIAHQFCVEGGGIEYQHKKRWTTRRGMLEINSRLFFGDFEQGLKKFFRDVRRQNTNEHARFVRRFKEAYPH